jgi:hypothetical protein
MHRVPVGIIKLTRMNKLIASSVDPNQLSLTLKGIIIGVAPIAMLVLHAVGKNITQDQLQAVVEVTTNVVAALGALVSSIIVAVGVIRKLVLLFKG